MKSSIIPILALAAALPCACSRQDSVQSETSRHSLTTGRASIDQPSSLRRPLSSRQLLFRQTAKKLIPWNSSDALAFEPAGHEHLARGPSALCMDQEGRPVVINPLNGTGARFSGDMASFRFLFATDHDFEDITCSPQGFVLYSPLRSLVEIRGLSGQRSRTLQVPRQIRRVAEVRMDGSDLWLHTALQERWRLTRAGEPLALPAVQVSKQEGFPLQDGTSVQVVVRNRHADIIVLSAPSNKDGRVTNAVARKIPLLFKVDSLLPLWNGGNDLCMLAETRTQEAKGTVHVSRSLECVNLVSGARTVSVELPSPGIYAPRRWLAMSNHGLAVMVPRQNGLELTMWRLEVRR